MPTAFKCRMTFLKQHLQNDSSKIKYTNAVLKSDVRKIILYGSEFLKKYCLLDDLLHSPKTAGLSCLREDVDRKYSLYESRLCLSL